MGALLAVTIIAYSYSLTTLLQLADLNSPLAYVSFVPIVRVGAGGCQQAPEPAGTGHP